MSFKVLDQLSLPGGAGANEDALAHDGRAAVVMDGATMLGPGLMPGDSDAAWIARFGARRILAHLQDGAGPRAALRRALGDTKKSFEALRRAPPEDMWQTPCASMMLVVETDDGAELLWFGDCAALMEGADGQVTVAGKVFASRAAEARRATALAPDMAEEKDWRVALRGHRNRINSGGNWLFTPDPGAAAHAGRRLVTLQPGALVLLASDGFLALASDYGAYDAGSLLAAARGKGLAALGAQLRAIENADSARTRFARFKTSDDATALLLRRDDSVRVDVRQDIAAIT